MKQTPLLNRVKQSGKYMQKAKKCKVIQEIKQHGDHKITHLKDSNVKMMKKRKTLHQETLLYKGKKNASTIISVFPIRNEIFPLVPIYGVDTINLFTHR